MELVDAINSRVSVRAFSERTVEPSLVERILTLAARAPSGNNTQPWRVHVVTGGAKARLTEKVLAARNDGDWPEREYRYTPRPLPEPYRTRSRESGRALYQLLGIGRGDDAAHQAQQKRNYQFFDAPVGLFLFMDRTLVHGSWLDCGMFLQTLMLAAREFGLHTCAQGAWANFHPIVREHLAVADDQLLICGVSLGYADESNTVNTLSTSRLSIDDFVTWVPPDSAAGT